MIHGCGKRADVVFNSPGFRHGQDNSGKVAADMDNKAFAADLALIKIGFDIRKITGDVHFLQVISMHVFRILAKAGLDRDKFLVA